MAGTHLRTENLTRKFGPIVAVDSVSLEIPEDSVTAIIGPNGAGKTTMFNLLTGVLSPTAGRVYFQGERIDDLSPEHIVERGIVRSYQVTNIFPRLTVRENVRLSTQSGHSGFRPRDFLTHYTKLEEATAQATAVLDRVGLQDVRSVKASNLSHGQQRRLDVAIALASDPDLLLLDEPTAGMSPEETSEMTDLLRELASEVTIVIVEHDMDVVMDLSDRIAVMNWGSLLTVGTPEAVQNDREVQEAYLAGGTA